MVVAQSGSEIAAVFHVAQLAWLAGLVVPAAIRSALLPVLGAARSTPIEHRVEMNRALDMCFGLLPYGLFGGYLVVWGFAPLAFPSTFFDGRYGASAVDLFAVLLGGWGLTLLATPTYTGLMAGWRPWRFTQFIVLVLLVALVVGYAFIVHAATSDGTVLFAAAWASTVSAGALLVLSWVMGDDLAFVSSRRDEWALALLGTSFVVAGLASHTAWWVFGLRCFSLRHKVGEQFGPRLHDGVGARESQPFFGRNLRLPTVLQRMFNAVCKVRRCGGFDPMFGKVVAYFAHINLTTGVPHNNDSLATKGPASRVEVMSVTSAVNILS